MFTRTLLAAGILAMTGAASAVHASTPRPAATELGRYVDVIAPDQRGREFMLLNADLGPSLEIGCDGSPDFKLFQRIANELEELVKSLQQQILGLAINYIIFSNPTLYQIYENINIHREFLRKLMVFSCSSVRQMAAQARTDDILAKAKSQCLMDGARSPETCDNGDVLKKYIPEAGNRLDKQLARMQGAVDNFDLSEWVKQTMGWSVPPPGASSSGASLAKNEAAKKAEERVTDMMFSIKGGTATVNGVLTYVPEKKSVAKIVDESRAWYRDLLDKSTAIVDNIKQSSDPALPASKLDVSSVPEWTTLQQDPVFGQMSPGTFAMLVELRRTKPWAYEEAASALSRELSLAAARHAVATLELAMRAQTTGVKGMELREKAPGVIEAVEAELARLRSELAIEEARALNVQRVNDVINQVLRLQ